MLMDTKKKEEAKAKKNKTKNKDICLNVLNIQSQWDLVTSDLKRARINAQSRIQLLR